MAVDFEGEINASDDDLGWKQRDRESPRDRRRSLHRSDMYDMFVFPLDFLP